MNFLDGRCDELQNQIKNMYENEFTDSHASKNEMSREDKTVERLFDTECELVDGHFQIPLPWKDGIEDLPNNREMAAHRLSSLKKRLQRDPTLFGKYNQFMSGLISKGHAERVPNDSCGGQRTWYLPHHAVIHPKKPDKVRVVFDAAARFRGTSLNESLLQGPDLTNSLVGVLLRFRLEKIAVAADIESIVLSG